MVANPIGIFFYLWVGIFLANENLTNIFFYYKSGREKNH